MKLTVYIAIAADGKLQLRTVELPGLHVETDSLTDIEEAVRRAAAEETGKRFDEFAVEIQY